MTTPQLTPAEAKANLLAWAAPKPSAPHGPQALYMAAAAAVIGVVLGRMLTAPRGTAAAGAGRGLFRTVLAVPRILTAMLPIAIGILRRAARARADAATNNGKMSAGSPGFAATSMRA